MQKWTSIGWLPVNSTRKWSILTGRIRTEYDSVSAVLHSLRKWDPLQPTLVARPEDGMYLPPVCIPELAVRLRTSFRRRSAVGVGIMISCAALMFPLAISRPSRMTYGFVAIFALMAITRWLDAFVSLATLDSLADRVRFSIWIRSFGTAKRGLIFWASCMILIGAAQMYLQHLLGGRDALLDLYGATYAGIRDGQFWRLVVGPFVHSTAVHYINNLLLLLFIGPITWAMLGAWSIIVFIVGNIVGAIFQMYFGSPIFDVYAGISAGIFALFSLFVVSAVLSRALLPKGVALLCCGITMISIVGAELVSVSSATTAHLGGLVAGSVFAAALYVFKLPK